MEPLILFFRGFSWIWPGLLDLGLGFAGVGEFSYLGFLDFGEFSNSSQNRLFPLLLLAAELGLAFDSSV